MILEQQQRVHAETREKTDLRELIKMERARREGNFAEAIVGEIYNV